MTIKLERTSVNFELIVSNALSVPAQQDAIASFARSKLSEAQQKNRAAFGYDPKFTSAVDGREGAELESVQPNGGRIVFDFEIYSDLIRDVITATLAALRAASPVVSGRYKDGHTLFVNGVPMTGVPETIKPDDLVMVANPVIYARRIEIGTTRSGRAFVIQVPNRIYERTAKSVIAPRFGNQFKITFGYAELEGAGTSIGRRGRAAPVASPAIFIGRLG